MRLDFLIIPSSARFFAFALTAFLDLSKDFLIAIVAATPPAPTGFLFPFSVFRCGSSEYRFVFVTIFSLPLF